MRLKPFIQNTFGICACLLLSACLSAHTEYDSPTSAAIAPECASSSWPSIVGQHDKIGPKAQMLIEEQDAYTKAGFAVPPRLVLAADTVTALANLTSDTWTESPIAQEVHRKLKALMAENPFSQERWPFMLRISDWALGVGGLLDKSVSSRPVIDSIFENVLAMSKEIVNTYGDGHVFVKEHNYKPGIIIEPMVATLGDTLNRYASSPREWSSAASGSCFVDQPGPQFGTYCVIAPGLRGGSYWGNVIREGEQDWPTRGGVRNSINALRSALSAPSGDEKTYSIVYSFPQKFNEEIWARLRQVRAQVGHPLYVEWALIEQNNVSQVYLLQTAALHEPKAIIGSETIQRLLDSPIATFAQSDAEGRAEVYGGIGTPIRITTIAIIPNVGALFAYASRMKSSPQNVFYSLGGRPHMLWIGEDVVTSLRTKIAWGTIDPVTVFQGAIGVIDMRWPYADSGHDQHLPDHFGTGFVESGRFATTIQANVSQIEELHLNSAATELLTKLSTNANLAADDTGMVLDVNWFVTSNQALDTFHIYDASLSK